MDGRSISERVGIVWVFQTTAVADRLGARRSVGSGPDLRQIQLTRPGTGLGFSIRGGREFDLGIYVSK